MRIGIIHHGGAVRNRGIKQLAFCLSDLGHEVFIFAGHDQNIIEGKIGSGIHIYYFSRFFGQHAWCRSIPATVNPLWLVFLLKNIRKLSIEAIILRESVLSWQAIYVSKKLGIPAYLDMRENLAEMYDSFKDSRKIFNPMKSRYVVRGYERINLPSFEGIFTVTTELRKWLVATYQIDPFKIKVLGNYPSRSFLNKVEDTLSLLDSGDDSRKSVRFVFAGLISENRGLMEAIEALKYVIDHSRKVKLVVIGEGDYLSKLKETVERLNLDAFVEFKPMLNESDLISSLAECDVGLLPYRINLQTTLTIPGKLFEYMAVGLPVLTSKRETVLRVLDSLNCGVVYESQNYRDIAHAMFTLIDNNGLRLKLGANGRKAVLKYYNWKNNRKILSLFFGNS